MATDVITDNFLSCRETPPILNSSHLAEIRRAGTCETCKVRFTSLIAGTGSLTVTPQGLSFELPQAALEVSGIRHTCYGALLSVPAIHSLDFSELGMKTNDLSGAEIHVRFQGETSATRNSKYVLVLPVKIGNDGPGVPFFESLGILQRNRPLLSSSLPANVPLVLYKGTSLEDRVASTSSACSNTVEKVSYLVALKPLTMRLADLNRFKRQVDGNTTYKPSAAAAGTYGPPRAAQEPTAEKLKLFSYIEKLTLTTSAAGGTKRIQNGFVETEQVKCRPLDTIRDIRGDKVYVGGPGRYKTLKKELEDAADMSKGLEDPEGGADVSKIETILGIILGIVIGLFLISLIAYYVFKYTESRYLKLSVLYAVARLKNTTSVQAVGDVAKEKKAEEKPLEAAAAPAATTKK